MIIFYVLVFLPALTTAHILYLLQNLTNAITGTTLQIATGTSICEGILQNATGALLNGTPLMEFTLPDGGFLSSLLSSDSEGISLNLTSGLLGSGLLSSLRDSFNGTTRLGLLSTLGTGTFNNTLFSTILENKLNFLNTTLTTVLENKINLLQSINGNLGSGLLSTILENKISRLNSTLQNGILGSLFQG